MKFENTQVWGFEHAMRGMRNPMNSWDKSDSKYCKDCIAGDTDRYIIGDNDMNLAKRLINAGTEHRKFLRQVFVSVDITAPLFWWKEFDTYKIGTVANSTSTMHKLATTPITLDCFETDDYVLMTTELKSEKALTDFYIFDEKVRGIIDFCEELRKKYIETKNKVYWKELIRWLPESWLQTRTVTLNYENLLSIYNQRKNHKLNEWSGIDNDQNENFISWMLQLPYMRDFLGLNEEVLDE